jgi:hypothetical protein
VELVWQETFAWVGGTDMGMGGGKGGGRSQAPMEIPAATPAPIYQYPTDTSALVEEKNKQQKALMLRQGRQSTILTDESLNAPTTSKRQLLGA